MDPDRRGRAGHRPRSRHERSAFAFQDSCRGAQEPAGCLTDGAEQHFGGPSRSRPRGRTGRRTLCAMTDAPDGSLVQLVEIWHRACADFVALTREIPRDQWDLPTDLEGWTVKDVVAHTAHLEAVLAGAPEETIEVAEAPHLKGLMNYYTEQGV